MSRIKHIFLKIFKPRACKYAKITSYKSPPKCPYKEIVKIPNDIERIILHCPQDSGTDGKCNKRCYEYEV
jgi:hypothetical protein